MDLSKYPLQIHRDIKNFKDDLIKMLSEMNIKRFLIDSDEKYFLIIRCPEPINNFYFGICRDYSLSNDQRKIKYTFELLPYNAYQNDNRVFQSTIEVVANFLKGWIKIVSEYLEVDNIQYEKYQKNENVTRVQNTYPQNIHLKTFQFLKNIELNELSNKKEIYILGENGDGKTVLLQALMLAFKEHFVKNIARKSLVGEFLDFDNDFKEASYEIELEDKTILSKTNLSYHSDVYAYGTHRGTILSETEDEYGFMTLFSPRYHLRNPVDWLVDLRGKELEIKSKTKEENQDTENQETQTILTLETAKTLLEDIINSSENPKDIHIEVDLSTKEKVVFKERNTKIKFEHLSEGYRSVFIWVADLVSRLAESQPTVNQIQDFKGIVLVDEINLHLHPKWEIQIVQKLRSWFPNIQFFLTTHSPICVLGASEDAVFYRLYKENGVAQLSEQIEYSQIKEMTANQVVTSMLFDLDTPFMKHTDSSQIDTSEDYLYNRIHKKISQRLEERKKEGEVYFSDEEINAMIDEALDTEIENDEIE